MAEKMPSFKNGGAFWFLDLTTPDTTYIFPVLTALTFWITVEVDNHKFVFVYFLNQQLWLIMDLDYMDPFSFIGRLHESFQYVQYCFVSFLLPSTCTSRGKLGAELQ